ncbi:5'-3' exoribonuclease 1 [Cucumispora dikerogammari]|nr:5'-3' exoribonuclease 1 [Cucumispora dikerogammari]
MGIPGHFRWLKEKYPTIVSHNRPNQTEYLHIDFSALIHMSCHPDDGGSLTQEQMFDLLAYNMNSLVERCKPTRTLHIATDGVTPRGKLNQQRERSFIRSKEQKMISDEVEKSETAYFFDTNCIAAGTVFMKELNDFVCDFIKKKHSTDENYKNLEIIYSNDSVPGEGEYKILEFIKLTESNTKHSIYACDSDLIFLSLTLPKHNIHIIREDLDHINTFKRAYCSKCDKKGHWRHQCCKLRLEKVIYVSVTALKNCLKKFFDVVNMSYNLDNMINDLILVSLFLGNDFLPALPFLDVRSGGIEFLMETMVGMFNGIYLTTHSGINLHRLKDFMNRLAQKEKVLYKKKADILSTIRRRARVYTKFDGIDLSVDKNKEKYYLKKLNIKDDKEKDNLCKAYLKEMAWLYGYYQGKLKNWDFFYPKHLAPMASDLCKQEMAEFEFPVSEPVCRFVQLLLVLPKDSKRLVPVSLQKIFDNHDLYPSKAKIDMFDKLWEWEGMVVMDPICIRKLTELFEENKQFLTEEEISRNENNTKVLSVKPNTQDITLKGIEELLGAMKI